jgi:hypothetical protein
MIAPVTFVRAGSRLVRRTDCLLISPPMICAPRGVKRWPDVRGWALSQHQLKKRAIASINCSASAIAAFEVGHEMPGCNVANCSPSRTYRLPISSMETRLPKPSPAFEGFDLELTISDTRHPFSILIDCSISATRQASAFLRLRTNTHQQKAMNSPMTGSGSDHASSELRPRLLLANFES